MSDAEVLRLIEEMEQRLKESAVSMDSAAIAQWHDHFKSAVEHADRGPGWSQIVARAHALAGCVDVAVASLLVERDSMKHEMEAQTAGRRALNAYKPDLR